MKRPEQCPSCGCSPMKFQPLPNSQVLAYGCGSQFYGTSNSWTQSPRCLIAEQAYTIAALRQELAESRAKEGSK